jgi:uncharacterized membrane protein
MKTRLFVAAIAAALVAGLPDVAAAQSKPGMVAPGGKPGMAPSAPMPSSTVDVRVCNRSGRNGTVAISYVEVGTGQFVTRGWYEVQDGACRELVSTDNANFYMYGDTLDGSGRVWSGDHSLCVQYPGPYTLWYDGSDTCPTGYETRNFVQLRSDSFGSYTWNLDP